MDLLISKHISFNNGNKRFLVTQNWKKKEKKKKKPKLVLKLINLRKYVVSPNTRLVQSANFKAFKPFNHIPFFQMHAFLLRCKALKPPHTSIISTILLYMF